MRRHDGHAGVQEQGCAAIWNLTAGSDFGLRCDALMSQGVGEVVVAAMRRHGGHAGVQEYGCGAMRSLAFGSDARKKALESLVLQARTPPVKFKGQESGASILSAYFSWISKACSYATEVVYSPSPSFASRWGFCPSQLALKGGILLVTSQSEHVALASRWATPVIPRRLPASGWKPAGASCPQKLIPGLIPRPSPGPATSSCFLSH
eukprot:scaffold6429_cov220-Pinguiococcus_pyrenoidosus.AAC.1